MFRKPVGSLGSLQQTELGSAEATRSDVAVCGARVAGLSDTRGAAVSRWRFNATTTQSITANRSRENCATSIAFRRLREGLGGWGRGGVASILKECDGIGERGANFGKAVEGQEVITPQLTQQY